MARTKKESSLKTWREVDLSIKALGNLEIKKNEIEGALTREINKIKERYALEADNIKAEALKLKTDIERFCEQNKSAFLKKRTKILNYGSVNYRISESVKYNQSEKSIIESIERLNLDFVLKVVKKVDKERIKDLDANLLTKIGVSVVKKDGLSIIPDIAKIAGYENLDPSLNAEENEDGAEKE